MKRNIKPCICDIASKIFLRPYSYPTRCLISEYMDFSSEVLITRNTISIETKSITIFNKPEPIRIAILLQCSGAFWDLYSMPNVKSIFKYHTHICNYPSLRHLYV